MTHPTYPLRALALEDYAITGLDAVMTPALVIYPEYVDNNIAATLRVLGGDRNRFRPHIKTAKLISVMRQYVGHDITRFKCATTLELLALIEAGARDVLLSYPLVGAGARRLRAITDAHPNVVISGLVENVEQLQPYAGSRVGVFIDINPGMDRTGLRQERIGDALAIVRATRDLGIVFRGLHYYDGHLARHPMPERTQHAHAGYEVLLTMARALQADGHGIGEIITSGTPAFPCSATFEPFAKGEGWVHRASPGTTVFYDINTYGSLPDAYGYRPAALVVSTVVSHPRPGRYCCDAGHKALGADAGVPTGYPIGRPGDTPLGPTEEHLPVDSPEVPAIGSAVYWVPKHVCPTVNLAEHALIVRRGQIEAVERVAARGREHPLLAQ